ncbi:hypothetical protein O3P69_001103 [Scylla paramamosain]|uniref:alpha-1,2-Mannosidase n=2 Tax=Scylla paramamosain TaxID=85552 RepID=A0AAW0URV2_SCYPA
MFTRTRCILPVACLQICFLVCLSNGMSDQDIRRLREEVRGMFYHAYDGYMRHAYPYDELRPLSCDGHDTWGSYSLTLIDALDTLAVMGNKTEFQRVVGLILERTNFDVNINVSVFETNIRILGGLLSGHLMSRRMGSKVEEGWPCSGPLLRMAKDVADRLLPAFDTPTGMPYGTVNLREGVPDGETPITCTAGVGTYIVEFGTLSRLTGDPVYEEVALRALHALWNHRSAINLVGNHIDVLTGRWTAQDSGIGAGIDSYFEYMVKAAGLLQRPELMAIFKQAWAAIEKHLRHEDWYLWATMTKGYVTMAVFQSLEAYWPGVLTLVGDVNTAQRIVYNYHQVWKQFGFTPEFYNIPQSEAPNNREGYPLRPELVESLMYLFQATKDHNLLEMAADIVVSIQHSAKTECGYATVKNVNDHTIENRMESFFLAETTKYLYLIFDHDNWIHNTGRSGHAVTVNGRHCVVEAGGYVFNSEAHPVDPGALACCSMRDDDWSLSLADQVALILDPMAPWKGHLGHRLKEEKEDCNSDGKLSYQEASQEVEESELEEAPRTTQLGEGSVVILHGNGKILAATEVPKETKSEGEKPLPIPSASRTPQPQGQGMDESPSVIIDYANKYIEKLKEASEGKPVTSGLGSSSTADGETEVKERHTTHREILVDDDSGSSGIMKKDSVGPRFSSLSEAAERGGNTSGMEAASISPSVSSSKYSTSPGSPRIIPKTPKTPIPPIKKEFVLADLKERLVIDLSSYRNFTKTASYSLLSCPHPPFTRMLNFKGQMFYP